VQGLPNRAYEDDQQGQDDQDGERGRDQADLIRDEQDPGAASAAGRVDDAREDVAPEVLADADAAGGQEGLDGHESAVDGRVGDAGEDAERDDRANGEHRDARVGEQPHSAGQVRPGPAAVESDGAADDRGAVRDTDLSPVSTGEAVVERTVHFKLPRVEWDRGLRTLLLYNIIIYFASYDNLSCNYLLLHKKYV
jgi:hypothetical protein